jgi:hypothetical protein
VFFCAQLCIGDLNIASVAVVDALAIVAAPLDTVAE